jgi:hypothetical protein
MAEFKSLKALNDFLEKSIKSAIKDDPPKAVKNLMKKHILRDVYMVYKPQQYVRRYNQGGLMDERNIVIDSKENNSVEIYNITKRNLKYQNEYLAPVIEFGHEGAIAKGYRGYSYPNPERAYYHERPFIKNTRDSLIRSKSHVKAFQESLKRLGIRTK